MRKWISLALAPVICGLLVSQGALGAEFNTVPRVPADSQVMEAAPGVSAAQARYLGRWEGPLIGHKGQIPHTLVVERMEANRATVVWSTGDSTATTAAVHRLDATVTKEGDLSVNTIGWPMVYRMSLDGTSLQAVYTYYGSDLVGSMAKMSGPSIPYSAEGDRVTHWPANISTMRPQVASHAVQATLPTDLRSSTADGSPRARWLGKWAGGGCRQSCSIKLAVLQISGDSAQVAVVFTNKNGVQLQGLQTASFVGDELRIEAVAGQRLTFRFRGDAGLEVYRVARNGATGWAFIEREE